jgi:hypothetical protein
MPYQRFPKFEILYLSPHEMRFILSDTDGKRLPDQSPVCRVVHCPVHIFSDSIDFVDLILQIL